jgi:hypothetical protein
MIRRSLEELYDNPVLNASKLVEDAEYSINE